MNQSLRCSLTRKRDLVHLYGGNPMRNCRDRCRVHCPKIQMKKTMELRTMPKTTPSQRMANCFLLSVYLRGNRKSYIKDAKVQFQLGSKLTAAKRNNRKESYCFSVSSCQLTTPPSKQETLSSNWSWACNSMQISTSHSSFIRILYSTPPIMSKCQL